MSCCRPGPQDRCVNEEARTRGWGCAPTLSRAGRYEVRASRKLRAALEPAPLTPWPFGNTTWSKNHGATTILMQGVTFWPRPSQRQKSPEGVTSAVSRCTCSLSRDLQQAGHKLAVKHTKNEIFATKKKIKVEQSASRMCVCKCVLTVRLFPWFS